MPAFSASRLIQQMPRFSIRKPPVARIHLMMDRSSLNLCSHNC